MPIDAFRSFFYSVLTSFGGIKRVEKMEGETTDFDYLLVFVEFDNCVIKPEESFRAIK